MTGRVGQEQVRNEGGKGSAGGRGAIPTRGVWRITGAPSTEARPIRKARWRGTTQKHDGKFMGSPTGLPEGPAGDFRSSFFDAKFPGAQCQRVTTL